MIVRIVSEGQYEIDSGLVDRLNALDNRLVGLVGQDDGAQFDRVFHELVELVRTNGRKLDDAELAPSDVVLPSPDSTFPEVKELFTDEGLVPG